MTSALLTAPPAVVLAHALERRDRGGTVRWTVTIGIAALPLLLAYLNRHGPGTWCHPIGTPRHPGVECADEWDPRPFLAIGLALLLTPAAAIALALADTWRVEGRRVVRRPATQASRI